MKSGGGDEEKKGVEGSWDEGDGRRQEDEEGVREDGWRSRAERLKGENGELRRKISRYEDKLEEGNAVVKKLLEQLRLNDQMSPSKAPFNPYLIVQMVKELRVVKEKLKRAELAGALLQKVGAKADTTSQSQSSVGHAPVYLPFNTSVKSSNRAVPIESTPANQKTAKKLSNQLHFEIQGLKEEYMRRISCIFPINRVSFGDISLVDGYQFGPASSLKANFDSLHEMSRLSLAPDFDSTRIDSAHTEFSQNLKTTNGRGGDQNNDLTDKMTFSNQPSTTTPTISQSIYHPQNTATTHPQTSPTDPSGAATTNVPTTLRTSINTQVPPPGALLDLLAESEARCSLMKARLQELVSFLQRLLDNPDISALIDIAMATEQLDQTTQLVDDMSVWLDGEAWEGRGEGGVGLGIECCCVKKGAINLLEEENYFLSRMEDFNFVFFI